MIEEHISNITSSARARKKKEHNVPEPGPPGQMLQLQRSPVFLEPLLRGSSMCEDLEDEGTAKLENKGQKETEVLDNVVNAEGESTVFIFSETRTVSLSLAVPLLFNPTSWTCLKDLN